MHPVIIPHPDIDDPTLVARHLAGDRAAFRQIVERYQGMVCALAYSACGDVARSEDLAQEVFVAAWKQLPQLREPAKLRAWLGGITRNTLNASFRRAGRTPTVAAEALSEETPAEIADPGEQAVGRDEAALMWKALAGLPEAYREPMVLFYREQQSMPAVAAALEISEEAARQRLARGRAMLTERMAKLVEESLTRTVPARAFAGAVMLTIPAFTAPLAFETTLGGGAATKSVTAASAVGGAVAKGGVAIKVLAAFAALPALLNGLTEYLRFRAHLASANPGNRPAIIRSHVMPLLINAVLLGGMALIFWVPLPAGWTSAALVVVAAAFVITAGLEHRRKVRTGGDAAVPVGSVFEYRSRQEWLGLPWVHVVAGGPWRRRRATGWIALSDGVAIGGLFASAPLAVAPLSMGGVAVGLLGMGGLAVGLGALGVVAAGVWVAGGMALAAHAAQGGAVFARDFAVGIVAVSAHANDAAAREFFHQHVFFRATVVAWRVAVWMAFFGWLPPLALIGWHLWRGKRSAR